MHVALVAKEEMSECTSYYDFVRGTVISVHLSKLPLSAFAFCLDQLFLWFNAPDGFL